MSDKDVVRTVGPLDLPETIQGATLRESLARAARLLATAPRNRGPIISLSDASALGLERLLSATADTLSVLEEQLQQQIDQHIELLEDHERLLPPAPGWFTTDNLVVQVVYEGDDFEPFVQGLWGWAVLETVSQIDEQLREDPESYCDRGRGAYRFSVKWVEPEYAEYGQIANAGYFDLTFVQFVSSAKEAADGR